MNFETYLYYALYFPGILFFSGMTIISLVLTVKNLIIFKDKDSQALGLGSLRTLIPVGIGLITELVALFTHSELAIKIHIRTMLLLVFCAIFSYITVKEPTYRDKRACIVTLVWAFILTVCGIIIEQMM